MVVATCCLPNFVGFPSITTLDLSNNQLAGALAYLTSPSLNPFLTTIDLSNNLLTGTVPPGFGGLTALRTLNLLSNRMHYAGAALLPPFITPDYDSTTVNTTGTTIQITNTTRCASAIQRDPNFYY